MGASRPKISIVIPCLNEANYIGRALASLNQQECESSYEVIVVDNNCTDKTAIIAEGLGARVVKEIRPGVCWARDRGTREAKGEIIISTDADNLFAKDWLAKIEKTFKDQPDIVGVAGPCKYIDGPFWGQLYPKFLFGVVRLTYNLTGKTIYGSATNISFKKSAWAGYDTTLTQGGDEIDLLRNLQEKGKLVFDSHIFVFTSARRLKRGLFYNLFISFFFYYFLAYNLNRIFKRRVLGSAPAYRTEKNIRVNYLQTSVLFILLLFLVFGYHRPRGIINTSYRVINSLKKEIIGDS